MNNKQKMLAFGPVPSRRLGQSIGINNIPPKICSYSCVYCQLGRTNNLQVKHEAFYKPKELAETVKNKVKTVIDMAEPIDYLTFVPDGEPTLDINLGEEIGLLTPLEIKIAVITNSSLLWDDEVRNALSKADLISVKIDAISHNIWQKINRPHKSLIHKEILAEIESELDKRDEKIEPNFARLGLTVEEINTRIREHEKKLNDAAVKQWNTLDEGEYNDKH